MDRCPSCDMELEPREEGWAECPLCGDTLADFKVPDNIAPEVDDAPPEGISLQAAAAPPVAAGFDLPPGPTDPKLLPELDLADSDVARPVPPAETPVAERSMPELANIIAASRARPQPEGASDSDGAGPATPASIPRIELPEPEPRSSARPGVPGALLDPPLDVPETSSAPRDTASDVHGAPSDVPAAPPEESAPARRRRRRGRTRLGRVVLVAALLFLAIAGAHLGTTGYATLKNFAPLLQWCEFVDCGAGFADGPVEGSTTSADLPMETPAAAGDAAMSPAGSAETPVAAESPGASKSPTPSLSATPFSTAPPGASGAGGSR